VCNPPKPRGLSNAKGQIVGESATDLFFTSTRAFLWEKGGPMIDLNTLIPPSSDMELASAASINDRGEIDGDGVLSNGDTHAFLLIPCDEEHPNVEGCDYRLVDEAETANDPAPEYFLKATERLTQSRRTNRHQAPVGVKGSER